MKTSKFCQEQIVAALKLVELPPRFESIKLKESRPVAGPGAVERNTGFEPATFALARRRSTS